MYKYKNIIIETKNNKETKKSNPIVHLLKY